MPGLNFTLTRASMRQVSPSSLDIYVFGSTTENGTYTYQERFSYRESSAEMPSGNDVTPLDLTAVGSDGKQTNALLSLKKETEKSVRSSGVA